MKPSTLHSPQFLRLACWTIVSCCALAPHHGEAQQPVKKSEPPELTTLRKDFESKALAAIAPVSDLQTKFFAALQRIRAASKDTALQAATDQLHSTLLKGEPTSPSSHPDVEKLRLTLLAQQKILYDQHLPAWRELANAHRAAVEQFKSKVGSSLSKWATDALNQELVWIEAEQAWLAKNQLPWQSGEFWLSCYPQMKPQGLTPPEVRGDFLLLKAGPKRDTRLRLPYPLIPPFEFEAVVIPKASSSGFLFDGAHMLFNDGQNRTDLVLVDYTQTQRQGPSGKRVPGKPLQSGVEQKLNIRVYPQNVELLVNDTSLHTFEIDLASMVCSTAFKAYDNSELQIKPASIRYRRPGAVHRPSSTELLPMASAGPVGTGVISTTAPATAVKPTPPPPSTPPAGASTPSTAATRPPADTTWPRVVGIEESPEVIIVEENEEEKRFVYRSPHYEFICDSRLGTNVVREFGRIFEATYLVNCKLPLDFKPEPEPLKKIFTAQLFTSRSDYDRAVDTPGTAGVYNRGKKSILVPLSSLGVKMVGSRVSLDYRDQDQHTLIHEITHQMMNHWLRKLPPWITEGSAEFVAWAGYDNGRFNFGQTKRLIPEKLARRGVQADGAFLPNLEKLMSFDGREWNAQVGGGGASKNYAAAALLVYYFYVLDDKGDGANMIAFMRAIESGIPHAEATAKHLMRGRTHAELEKQMKAALRSEGVTIDYFE